MTGEPDSVLEPLETILVGRILLDLVRELLEALRRQSGEFNVFMKNSAI